MKLIIVIIVAISIIFFLYYENSITNKQIKTEIKEKIVIKKKEIKKEIKKEEKQYSELEKFLINDNKKIEEHNIDTIKNNQEKTYYKSQNKSIKYDGYNIKRYDEDIHKNKELKRQSGSFSFSNEKNYKNDIRNYEYFNK